MPIYEFYCGKCHRIFNFLSIRVNTDARPTCPRCKKVTLSRKVSPFAALRGLKEDSEGPDLSNIDESRLERAMGALAGEMERMDENDPRQAADLMRKLTDMTGMDLGPGMQEALRRMEAGEDPDQIEAEMGDLLEGEDPFSFGGAKAGKGRKAKPPARDEELYML